MKLITLVTMTLLMTACAHSREKLLDANWVSMKNNMPPSSLTKLKAVGPVSAEYCLDSFGAKGSFGLMDEAVKKVEANYNVDYIKAPSFTKSVGHECVQVSGDGYQVIR